MNDFESILEIAADAPLTPSDLSGDGLPKSSFLDRVKAINWGEVNNRATIASNILFALYTIIISTQKAVSSAQSVRTKIPSLFRLQAKVGQARAALKPLVDEESAASDEGEEEHFEGVERLFNTITEEGGWQKATIVFSAVTAILVLITQLLNLVARIPEFHEKIGPLVNGMQKDAADLKREAATLEEQ